MITDETTKHSVYQNVLKTAQKRLEQAIPGSTEGAFAHLSLAAILNLLFLLRGEWGLYRRLRDYPKSPSSTYRRRFAVG